MSDAPGPVRNASLDEAWARLERELRPVPPQRIDLAGTLGLRLAGPLVARHPVPPRACARVDGYAVRSADLRTTGDRTFLPTEGPLVLSGEPIPDGADAVVPIEHVQSFDGRLTTQRAVRSGEHVMPAGCVHQAGESVLDSGTVVTPTVLALVASLGERSLRGHPRPRVAILGLSRRRRSRSARPGARPDPSIELVHALARDAGADVVATESPPFPWRTLGPELQGIVESVDAVLVTPGASRLALDTLLAVLATIGPPIVQDPMILPGRHTSAWLVSRRPILVLAGSQADIIVGFEALGRPALGRLAGDPDAGWSCIRARTASRVVHHPGRTEFVPVVLEQRAGSLVAAPLTWPHDADLRGTTHADGFAILEPSDRSVDAGAPVCVRGAR